MDTSFSQNPNEVKRVGNWKAYLLVNIQIWISFLHSDMMKKPRNFLVWQNMPDYTMEFRSITTTTIVLTSSMYLCKQADIEHRNFFLT